MYFSGELKRELNSELGISAFQTVNISTLSRILYWDLFQCSIYHYTNYAFYNA